MAFLYITAYQGVSSDQRGNTVQAGLEPAIWSSTISFTTATVGRTQLLTFSAGGTNALYYRLHADTNTHFVLGTASTVSGTTSQARMAAGQTEFIGVDRPGLWISALAGA